MLRKYPQLFKLLLFPTKEADYMVFTAKVLKL